MKRLTNKSIKLKSRSKSFKQQRKKRKSQGPIQQVMNKLLRRKMAHLMKIILMCISLKETRINPKFWKTSMLKSNWPKNKQKSSMKIRDLILNSLKSLRSWSKEISLKWTNSKVLSKKLKSKLLQKDKNLIWNIKNFTRTKKNWHKKSMIWNKSALTKMNWSNLMLVALINTQSRESFFVPCQIASWLNSFRTMSSRRRKLMKELSLIETVKYLASF